MAVYFSYSSRLDALHACVVKDSEGNTIPQPSIRFAIDLNGTRIAAQHGLIQSSLRLSRSVKVYEAQSNQSWALKQEQWQSLAEFEGILDITKTMSTLAQSEAIFLGAYGPVLKSMTLKRLRKEEVSIIDIGAVCAAQPTPIRKKVAEVDLSEAGRTALHRARLEAERRWCDNTTEVVHNTKPLMSERERIAILLDLRTLKASCFSAAEFAEAEILLQDAYIAFGKKAAQFQKRKEQKQKEVLVDVQGGSAGPDTNTASQLPGHHAAKPDSEFEYDENMFDESGDDDELLASPAMPEQTSALAAEFKRVMLAWKKMKVDWKSYFPQHDIPSQGKPDLINNLMELPMGTLYKKLQQTDPHRLAYGWLPRMALCSRGQLGTLLAESFCERILSQANLVLTEGNTLLSHEELEMVVILRMNKKFMNYMREHYNHLSKQDFAKTVIRT